MLSDTITEPLFDIDKCSLNYLMFILQKIAKHPFIDVHLAGFGSYIGNHVLKGKKNDRYNIEAMIPHLNFGIYGPRIYKLQVEKSHVMLL
jgi:hypothetical protein